MCSRIKCYDCGKPTWAGCGAHIELVLRGVPPEDRCACNQTDGPNTNPLSFEALWAHVNRTESDDR
ncbi:MAG: hypothetical protein KC502_22355 [Myxococcales bacterium]|nr:hypothetical protein [Myxococcales bacterium]